MLKIKGENETRLRERRRLSRRRSQGGTGFQEASVRERGPRSPRRAHPRPGPLPPLPEEPQAPPHPRGPNPGSLSGSSSWLCHCCVMSLSLGLLDCKTRMSISVPRLRRDQEQQMGAATPITESWLWTANICEATQSGPGAPGA